MSRQIPLGETEVVRWFCYAGFAACSILLVVGLALGWDWRAPLVGTFVWGVPAVTMYRQEQQRRENLEVVRGAQAARGGGRSWSFDEPDDPTDAPTTKEFPR